MWRWSGEGQRGAGCPPGQALRPLVADQAKAMQLSSGPRGVGAGQGPQPPLAPGGTSAPEDGLLGLNHGVLGNLNPHVLRSQHLRGHEGPSPHHPGGPHPLQRQGAWP